MRIFHRLVLFGAVAVFAMSRAPAQDPAPTPEPGPAQAASQNAYPDIEALREPGSSAKFLPPETPAPTPGPGGPGAAGGTGRRNSGLPSGQHRRNARSNDQIGDLAAADPLAVRVAYRRAKTIVMARDPGLADLLREAAAAGTDVQKRAFLKVYYTRLFDEVRNVDRSPEMKNHVALLSQVARQRYDPQRRVVGGEEDIVRGGGRGRRRGR